MSEQDPSRETVLVQYSASNEPGCLIQGLWFLFVGWWLGGIAVSVAWILNVTVIGIPFGMAILNNVPRVLALQNPTRRLQVVQEGALTRIAESDIEQRPFLARALFFALIGWWWSGIWMGIAYLLCATIILMPVGLQMFRSTPAMTTLRRY